MCARRSISRGGGAIDRRSLLAAPAAIGLLSCAAGSWGATTAQPSAGGLLICGFRGTSPADPDVEAIRHALEAGALAGVILLDRNIRAPEQLGALTASLRAASPDRPPIIAIDQEGGRVARLGARKGFLEWSSAARLAGEAPDNEEILDYYSRRAGELAELGINLNLAPVVDLDLVPDSPVIGAPGRSYGSSVDTILRFAEIFIRAHRSVGVRTCLKHFPGHGSARIDSHDGPVDLAASWSSVEITPFQRLIDAGLADSVMLGHLLHPYLSDTPETPVSLSREAVATLREVMGFAGPIVTDDLQMGAITQNFAQDRAAIAAVRAGTTLLIHSNYRVREPLATAAQVRAAIDGAMAEGVIDAAAVDAQLLQAQAFRATLF